MLVIRREQMDLFQQVTMRSFEKDMILHVHEFAPRHCQVIGDEMVRQTVRLGIQRAITYGFTNHGPARFYIEMMFMFGSAFDTDPQMPWTLESLKGEEYMDQMDRSKLLYNRGQA